MKRYLAPIDHHKSFYNKCYVVEENGWFVLTSYETEVAKGDRNGNFVRLWDGWSATTARHVNAFRADLGLPAISKSEWDKMEVGVK